MKRSYVTKFVIVLLLVAFAFGSFAPTAQAAGRKGNTIVDVALAANAQTGEFSILIAALQAADPSVIQTLSGKRQYTVFAPTDAAFVSLLDELGLTADELLSDKELVTNVLLYHVAKGRRNSQIVLASERIRTLESGFLYQSGGVLTDENGRTANIVAVDIKASNGIIHVIDRVVLPAPEKTLVDVALEANAQTGEFSILIAALQAADPSVLETLSGRKNYTVFAPTDAAFVSLLGELGLTADELLSQKDLVTQVLLYHVARGKLDAAKVLASDKIKTLEGGFLYQSGGILTDENGRTANIVATDIKADNGIIHVIDRVVLPVLPTPEKTIVDVVLEANAQSGEFSILIAALQAADPSVLQTLSGKDQYTVFAPTDAAFVALLGELGLTANELLSQKDLVTQVLLYHVANGRLDSTAVLASDKIKTLEGGFLYQSGGILTDENGRTANIVTVDIMASNGIIHVIDRVVLPVLPTPEKTIVDVALEVNAQTGEFSILIAALQAADPSVLQTLSGKDQYTVFAPTDAAFVALLGELGLTANELLSQKDLVTQVLLYHVANGRLDSTAVLASDKIKTLEGGFLYQSGGVLTDENGRKSNIVTVDIMASNGIIHVIDRVVLPDLSTPPSNQVLDDFNRADGKFDGNWSGNKSTYRISSNQLQVWSNDANSDIYWNEAFGADQEAFVTFADVNEAATEQNLLLKAQSNQTWGDGVILVFYDAKNYAAQVWTWEWPKGWVKYGDDIPVAFTDGDTFTARARADGIVEVYRNGTLLDTRDITSWSYYDEGGYIGLWFMGARDAILDDFGGGNIP